ncbi:uroporphyrinogen-III C-methyltransferase [bacterium]|nr:uroporphyrinogen-III C-methyltransferase [bacterium]
MPVGLVYLVGAGPGDPGLVTRHAEAAIRAADTVVYDHLVHRKILEWIPANARSIYVGKRRGHQEMPQQEINRLLCDEALQGRAVVRLKGGDPYVFGRGAEEAEALAEAGVPFRVIPGVTAGIGALAYAGLAVTHRDHASAVTFVTGHDDPDSPDCRVDWPWFARFSGTVVVYMGMTRRTRIAQVLIENGKSPSTPVALVERGSWPDQKVETGTLKELADSSRAWRVKAPALIMIGEVVRLRPQLDWFSRLPLAGRCILLTRPEDDARRSESVLENLGAEVLIAPTIRVGPIADRSGLDDALGHLASYDWIVWTSANGVRFFFDRLFELGLDLRAVGHAKIAAIGPATSEALKRYGLNADVVPATFRSEDLADALLPHVSGKSVLLARADRGRTVLLDRLEPVASDVRQVAVYTNEDMPEWPVEIEKVLEEDRVDWVTLTSSAISRRFASLYAKLRPAEKSGRLKFASISPITSQAAREAGLEPTVEANQFTMEGLLDAILAYERRRSESG